MTEFDISAGVFDRGTGHEQVVYCSEPTSGLRAIIAIHSTALGPALGGTRFYPYGTEQEALGDVLDLSRAMTYKASLAGLDLGGGKAVILGSPEKLASEALFRAYGRFIASIAGRYITACDVGTRATDMDVIGRETRYVTGRTVEHGGAGDSSVLTAHGVYVAMQASAEHVWGTATLTDRRVGVAGVGKVGRRLVDQLVRDGARVVVGDVDEQAVRAVRREHPEVDAVATPEELITSDLDVYAPCALGGALDDRTVTALRATVVCGSANNQLAHDGVEQALQERGILYAPDYCVNSGGLIQVADEFEGFDFDRARSRASTIFDTTRRVFRLAEDEGVPPAVAADRVAEQRMTAVPAVRSVHLETRI